MCGNATHYTTKHIITTLLFKKRNSYDTVFLMKRLIKTIREKFAYLFRRLRGSSEKERALHALYDTFEISPEGSRIIEWRDAQKLSQLIRKYRPKHALEFGTGIGTASAVIADALPADGTLTTIEQTEKYIRIARALMPQELQKKITMVFSEPRAFAIPTLSPYLYFSGYKTIPIERGPFDFVFVDGPDPWYENGKLVALPNGDLITLIPHLAHGCIVYIDGRKTAVEMYRRFCVDYFSLISETKWYTVLKRTTVKARDVVSLRFSDAKTEKEE